MFTKTPIGAPDQAAYWHVFLQSMLATANVFAWNAIDNTSPEVFNVMNFVVVPSVVPMCYQKCLICCYSLFFTFVSLVRNTVAVFWEQACRQKMSPQHGTSNTRIFLLLCLVQTGIGFLSFFATLEDSFTALKWGMHMVSKYCLQFQRLTSSIVPLNAWALGRKWMVYHTVPYTDCSWKKRIKKDKKCYLRSLFFLW